MRKIEQPTVLSESRRVTQRFESEIRKRGQVLSFSRGSGFIKPNNSSKRVRVSMQVLRACNLAHKEQIRNRMQWVAEIRRGDRVEFTTDGGTNVTWIRKL